jgi:hypothetical protein
MARKPAAPKADEPKDDAPKRGIGDNGPSKDDITIAISEQVAWNEKRAMLNAEISSFRKTKKAEGIALGVLDDTVRMLEWTPEEIKAHFANERMYAEAAGLPVGTQIDLFGTGAQPLHEQEASKWFGLGKMHGLAGSGWPDEPPEGCPPENRQDYGRGHEAGAKELHAAIMRKSGREPRPDPDRALKAAEADDKIEGEEAPIADPLLN